MLLPSLSLVLGAASAAIIVFFGAGIAPVIFGRLSEADAGRVVRAVFPRYYLILGVLTAGAALAASLAMPFVAIFYAACAIGFVFARQVLMPRINTHRDAMLAGDASAGALFESLHKRSVQLNMVQLVFVAAAVTLTLWQMATS
ncbi:MAG: DUF4149 domain-containing protein [Pseudomonadota bacterium]